MSNFSPVFIPTLNRYIHFKRCVDTLAQCTDSDKTDLLIALDYPFKESHWEGYRKIKDYIPSISGFKSVYVIEREENYGVVDNINDGLDYVLKLHDRLILSEDDNEFSPNFLVYINSCLSRYENNDNVIAVTGYNRMIDMNGYSTNIYAAISYSAWGVGFLRKDFQFLQNEVITMDYAESIVKSWRKSYQIYKRFPSILSGLLSIVKTGHITGDTMIVSYMVLNQKYCIWPSISKVRNHGYDGGGEHFGSNMDHPLLTQEIDTNSSFEPDTIEIKENEVIRLITKQYGKAQKSLLNRVIFSIYIPVRYLIYRLTGIIIYK